MSKKKITYPARRDAELSFQFYRNKDGAPNFLLTSNPAVDGKDFCTGIDKLIFAENLVNSPLVSINEIAWLCDFFDRVRTEVKAKINKD